MPRATPGPEKEWTLYVWVGPSSSGVKTMSTLPEEGTTKSVALYWSPWAWRPHTMGFFHAVGRGGEGRRGEERGGERGVEEGM